MRKGLVFLLLLLSISGCAGIAKQVAGVKKIDYVKMETPYEIEAVKNYLPNNLTQPAYTIYAGSKWACNYKTEDENAVCCSDQAVAMGQWKYCVLVDEQQNGFAFFELGTSEYLKWAEGKQSLFKKKGGVRYEKNIFNAGGLLCFGRLCGNGAL